MNDKNKMDQGNMPNNGGNTDDQNMPSGDTDDTMDDEDMEDDET